jgi:DNA-binding MarR family transcriptional regulator
VAAVIPSHWLPRHETLSDDKALLLHDFDRVSRRVTRYANDLLASHGLSLNQGLVLLEVLRHDGCSAGQIGRALDFDSATLAGLLGRLERSGLVTRERSAADRRSVVVRPTLAARRARAAVRIALEDLDERLRRALPSRQVDEIASAHARILTELP